MFATFVYSAFTFGVFFSLHLIGRPFVKIRNTFGKSANDVAPALAVASIVFIGGYASFFGLPTKYLLPPIIALVLFSIGMIGRETLMRRRDGRRIDWDNIVHHWLLIGAMIVVNVLVFFKLTHFGVHQSPFDLRQGNDPNHYYGVAQYLWEYGGNYAAYKDQSTFEGSYIRIHLTVFSRIGSFVFLSLFQNAVPTEWSYAVFHPTLLALKVVVTVMSLRAFNASRKARWIVGLLVSILPYSHYNDYYPFLSGALMAVLLFGSLFAFIKYSSERNNISWGIWSIVFIGAILVGYAPGWPVMGASLAILSIVIAATPPQGNQTRPAAVARYIQVIPLKRAALMAAVVLVLAAPFAIRVFALFTTHHGLDMLHGVPRPVNISDFLGLTHGLGYSRHLDGSGSVFGFCLLMLGVILTALWMWRTRYRSGFLALAVPATVILIVIVVLSLSGMPEAAINITTWKSLSYLSLPIAIFMYSSVFPTLLEKIQNHFSWSKLISSGITTTALLGVVSASIFAIESQEYFPGWLGHDIIRTGAVWRKRPDKDSKLLVAPTITPFGVNTVGPVFWNINSLATIRPLKYGTCDISDVLVMNTNEGKQHFEIHPLSQQVDTKDAASLYQIRDGLVSINNNGALLRRRALFYLKKPSTLGRYKLKLDWAPDQNDKTDILGVYANNILLGTSDIVSGQATFDLSEKALKKCARSVEIKFVRATDLKSLKSKIAPESRASVWLRSAKIISRD